MASKKKHRSTLTLCISKVAEGDDSYRKRLCSTLADRLLYVPLEDSENAYSESDDSAISIKVKKIKLEDKTVVPVFTDESALQEWIAASAQAVQSISLLGADLCMVLADDIWLLIDPGSEEELNLDPESVKMIVQIGNEALADEFPQTDIIELDTPIDELQSAIAEFNANAEPQSAPLAVPVDTSDEDEFKPSGLKAWLGL